MLTDRDRTPTGHSRGRGHIHGPSRAFAVQGLRLLLAIAVTTLALPAAGASARPVAGARAQNPAQPPAQPAQPGDPATGQSAPAPVQHSPGGVPVDAKTAGTQVQSATPDAIITRDVPMAIVGDGQLLTVDVYQPVVVGNGRPAVVLVHGGAWFQGEPKDMDEPGILLARQGWVGFSVRYRLATREKPSWPDALSDLQRGIRWVGANAATYGADKDKIAVLGASAGGHLALMVGVAGTVDLAALTGQAAPDPNPPVNVRGVASWSAPTELADLIGNGGPPAVCGTDEWCQRFWEMPFVGVFLGCIPAACPDRYKQASPAELVGKATVPMWLANSTSEIVPLSQLQTMTDALEAAKIDHEVRLVDGQLHANEYTDIVWNDMVPWMADHLGVPAPQPMRFPRQPGSGWTVQMTLGLVFLAGLLTIVALSLMRQGGTGLRSAPRGKDPTTDLPDLPDLPGGKGAGDGGGSGSGPAREPAPA